MKIPRRKFLQLATGAAALPAITRGAWPQTYPTRPIRLIRTAGASPVDIAPCLISQWLPERLGQAVVSEEWLGGTSGPSIDGIAGAPAGGYPLLMVNAKYPIEPILDDTINFDLRCDIAPVAGIYYQPFVLGVNPSLAAQTVPEFIAYAKANHLKLDMGPSLFCTPEYVAEKLYTIKTGVLMRRDWSLVSRAMFDAVNSSIEQIRAGKLRALAVISPTRLEILPGISTIGEFMPRDEARGWQDMGAPKNTPAEITNRLNTEINVALADPSFRARLSSLSLGSVPLSMTPAEFRRFIAGDTEKVPRGSEHCRWELYWGCAYGWRL